MLVLSCFLMVNIQETQGQIANISMALHSEDQARTEMTPEIIGIDLVRMIDFNQLDSIDFGNVKRLTIGIDLPSLDFLTRFSGLQKLLFYSSKLELLDFSLIPKSLCQLTIFDEPRKIENIHLLATLPNLQFLSLNGKWNSLKIEEISNPNVNTLWLTEVTADDLNLNRFQSLKQLRFCGMNLSGYKFTGIKELESLAIISCKNVGVNQLKELHLLKFLELSDVREKLNLEFISELKNLEEFSGYSLSLVKEKQVTSKTLKSFYLQKCKIKILNFGACPKLLELNVKNNRLVSIIGLESLAQNLTHFFFCENKNLDIPVNPGEFSSLKFASESDILKFSEFQISQGLKLVSCGKRPEFYLRNARFLP